MNTRWYVEQKVCLYFNHSSGLALLSDSRVRKPKPFLDYKSCDKSSKRSILHPLRSTFNRLSELLLYNRNTADNIIVPCVILIYITTAVLLGTTNILYFYNKSITNYH